MYNNIELKKHNMIEAICIYVLIVFNFICPAHNHIIAYEQHGFKPGCSTTTSDFVFFSFIDDSFQVFSRSQVDAIYVDFSKTFDQVDYSLVLQLLDYLGIGDLF